MARAAATSLAISALTSLGLQHPEQRQFVAQPQVVVHVKQRQSQQALYPIPHEPQPVQHTHVPSAYGQPALGQSVLKHATQPVGQPFAGQLLPRQVQAPQPG